MPRTDVVDAAELRRALRSMVGDLVGWDLAGVSDDDHLLDYVTSSMDVVEGIRRIFDRFGVLIPIRTVMDGGASISALATYIHQAMQAPPDERPGNEGDHEPVELAPLAPSQQHIAFLMRYSTGSSAAYNESAVVRAEGPLDVGALARAFRDVCQRYEPVQVALSPRLDALEVGRGVVELEQEDCREEGVDRRLVELVARPFNPGQTLCRAAVLRVAPERHVIAVVSHALVVDRTALGTLLHDIVERYTATLDGGPPAPAPTVAAMAFVPQPSVDLPEAARLARVEHWRDLYGSGVPPLALPSDRPRPLVKSYEGARAVVRVDPALVALLSEWSVAHATTEAATIFGAFTCYLHRLTQLDDIVVGASRAPGAAVVQPQLMVPVRSTYSAGRNFADHVSETHASLADARRYGALSTAEIIQALELPRDQSRSPLFAAAFACQEPGTCPAPASLRATFVTPPAGGARFDIDVTAAFLDDRVELQCDYSTELFDDSTVRRWLLGMLEVLTDGMARPTTVCGALAVMASDERRTVLEEWTGAARPEWLERTTLELFDDQAGAAPNRPALRAAGQGLTYAELGRRVDAVALTLRAHGVQSGDRVGIFLERTSDLVAAMLATWRIGAAYVPLDLNLPLARLQFIVADADLRTVLTTRAVCGRLGDDPARRVLCLDDEHGSLSDAALGPMASLDDTAYVIYTSGSTGAPKGVEVVHRALANCLLAVREALSFSPDDSLLAVTTVSFDISAVELFLPLITGAVLELAEDGVAEDGIRLAERIDACRPSYVQTTPSSWKSLLATSWRGDRQMAIGAAGESFGRELAEELLSRSREVWNLYGPTETTVYATAHRVESAPGRPVPIGRPLPNTQLHVLDEHLQPLPIGAIGELHVGGVALARGYWRRDELTHERFVTAPFDGRRLYRTGDLARFLENGDVLCLGRLDDQLKVHGIRVEPGEVEAALREIDGVRDAVVTSTVDAYGDLQLVAHVLADPATTTPGAIRAGLRERIPESLVPPHIVFSDRFPLTHSGKVDRNALPAPDSRSPAAATMASPLPARPTERLVASIWADLLKVPVEQIHLDDDFLDLGGHSLLMTRLMVEVRERFDVTFTMRELFGASTVARFADLIDQRRKKRAGREHATAATARHSEWATQRMAFLRREAELPAHIAPARGLGYEPQGRPRSALLTGATGFLGAYIIAEILRTTDAHVHCLVRPKHGQSGRARIEAQMRLYSLWEGGEHWQSEWDARIHVVDGDVVLPRLGMVGRSYDVLADEIDCIIHSAAHVNFIYPYEALKATNVLGVHEIIRLAFHGRIKPVHYLSTAAVWPMGAEYTFREDQSLDHGMLLNLGYDEAKWVAERCLLHAADRGLPVARYRPGEVGGDSRTGQCVVNHFIIAGLKGFLDFGAFPVLDSELDVAPVDYVAQALVHLAFRRDPLGRAFHLTNPHRCHMSEALMFLRSVGYRFEELPFAQLRDQLISRPDFSQSALFPYQAVLEYMDDRSLELPNYDCSGTLRELEGSGIACPPVDERLLGAYVDYLQGIGFLPDVAAPHPESLTLKV